MAPESTVGSVVQTGKEPRGGSLPKVATNVRLQVKDRRSTFWHRFTLADMRFGQAPLRTLCLSAPPACLLLGDTPKHCMQLLPWRDKNHIKSCRSREHCPRTWEVAGYLHTFAGGACGYLWICWWYLRIFAQKLYFCVFLCCAGCGGKTHSREYQKVIRTRCFYNTRKSYDGPGIVSLRLDLEMHLKSRI